MLKPGRGAAADRVQHRLDDADMSSSAQRQVQMIRKVGRKPVIVSVYYRQVFILLGHKRVCRGVHKELSSGGNKCPDQWEHQWAQRHTGVSEEWKNVIHNVSEPCVCSCVTILVLYYCP